MIEVEYYFIAVSESLRIIKPFILGEEYCMTHAIVNPLHAADAQLMRFTNQADWAQSVRLAEIMRPNCIIVESALI